VPNAAPTRRRRATMLRRAALRWRRDAPHRPNDVLHFARNKLTHSKHEQARRVATHRVQGVAAQYREAARRHSARLQRGAARRNAAHCNGCRCGGRCSNAPRRAATRAGGRGSFGAQVVKSLEPQNPIHATSSFRLFRTASQEYPGVPRSTAECLRGPQSTPEYPGVPQNALEGLRSPKRRT
jgi:hypothetical protein